MPIYSPSIYDVSGNAVLTGGGGGGTISYNLKEYSSSEIWTKPTGLVLIEVVLCGSGGGGASGSRRATGVLARGGSSGAGGGCIVYVIEEANLGATESVTIGAGGTAGSAVTANDTDGTTGGAGGTTTFGTTAIVEMYGGTAGAFNAGGSTYYWNNGVVPLPALWMVVGAAGATSSGTGGSGDQSEQQSAFNGLLITGARATDGGGINTANTAAIGGVGNAMYDRTATLSAIAAGGTVPGGSGGNGISNYSNIFTSGPLMQATGNIGTLFYGTSAGAGGASAVGAGGNAGIAGKCCSGGSGGGASRNGANSGPGGAGAQGLIKILEVILS